MTKENSEKRTAILCATLKLITENGFAATPISLIAKEAGVAAGTIYLYFNSKEAMLQVIYLEFKEALTNATIAGFSENLPGRVAIELLLQNYLNFMLKNPLKFKFFEQFTNSPYINKLTKETGLKIFYPIVQVFERAKSERLIKDIPVQILYAHVLAPINHLLRQHLIDEFQFTPENTQIAFQACWDAIKS
jgi:AcrR family transcriptional regulator